MTVKVEKDGEVKEIQSEDLSFYERRLGYKLATEDSTKKKGKKLSEAEDKE